MEAGLVKRSRLIERANCKDDKRANLSLCFLTVGTTVEYGKGNRGGGEREPHGELKI